MTVDERIKLEETSDMASILSTEQGRRFLWRILSHCGIYQDIEVSDQMQRLLGRRGVGLFLLAELSDVNEDLVFAMMKEAKATKEYWEEIAANEAEALEARENLDEFNITDAPSDIGSYII